MQIVTGYRGQAHITSSDDQGRNQGVFGQNSYVLSVGSQFAPTLVSANELRIADGEAVMQGVHFRVDPSSFDSVTITNGTQGMNRKDLVVCRYTKDVSTGVENCEWVVIEGTPTSGTAARPSAVSGDILDGALVADMPFFEIVLSGINVTAVNSLFSKLMTMQEIQALAKTNESGISELNSKITIVRVTKTVNSGFVHVDWPSGVSMSTHRIVIAPLYNGTTIWSYVAQLLSSDIVVYVRIGSASPDDGTQITFDAVFIKL